MSNINAENDVQYQEFPNHDKCLVCGVDLKTDIEQLTGLCLKCSMLNSTQPLNQVMNDTLTRINQLSEFIKPTKSIISLDQPKDIELSHKEITEFIVELYAIQRFMSDFVRGVCYNMSFLYEYLLNDPNFDIERMNNAYEESVIHTKKAYVEYQKNQAAENNKKSENKMESINES